MTKVLNLHRCNEWNNKRNERKKNSKNFATHKRPKNWTATKLKEEKNKSNRILCARLATKKNNVFYVVLRQQPENCLIFFFTLEDKRKNASDEPESTVTNDNRMINFFLFSPAEWYWAVPKTAYAHTRMPRPQTWQTKVIIFFFRKYFISFFYYYILFTALHRSVFRPQTKISYRHTQTLTQTHKSTQNRHFALGSYSYFPFISIECLVRKYSTHGMNETERHKLRCIFIQFPNEWIMEL